MTFYQRIEALCKNKGTTVTALTIELGFSSSAGTTWKNLKKRPRNSTLKKIADYFELSIDELEREIDWPIDYDSVDTSAFNQGVWQHLLEQHNYNEHAAIDAYFAFEKAQMQDALAENSFNTVNGNGNIIGNGNAVGTSLTEHQKALLELFDKMDIVKQAQLLAYAAELVK